MAWTYTDDYSVIPNLYIRSCFNDGVLRYYQLYPCEGYVLYSPANDLIQYDEDGNVIVDENGNPVKIPYYSWGGAVIMPTYDFVTNPKQWQAVLYDESMTVHGGGVKPPTVTE